VVAVWGAAAGVVALASLVRAVGARTASLALPATGFGVPTALP